MQFQDKPQPSIITGDEQDFDCASPQAALSRFYAAFNQRDLDAMRDNWLQTPAAVMDNPLGGIERGWPAIEAVYKRIFGSANRVRVEFHDYTLLEDASFFCAIGRERGHAQSADGSSLDLAIRTSRVFVKREGQWRQAHHHGSIDDPELLQRYQRLIKGEAGN